jgi:hypothetical protein
VHADIEFGHEGLTGHHRLADLVDSPGAVCDIVLPGPDSLGETWIRVNPPVMFARDRTPGIDTQEIGWTAVIERAGVTVTTILPHGINTPFFNHARSKLGGVGCGKTPPAYQPEAVAEAIAWAAEHPAREIVVGGAAKSTILLQRLSPSLSDWLQTVGGLGFKLQQSSRPDDGVDNLFAPAPPPRHDPRRVRPPDDPWQRLHSRLRVPPAAPAPRGRRHPPRAGGARAPNWARVIRL